MSDPQSLPPSAEVLRKQAKVLRREWRSGRPEVLARVRASHPRFAGREALGPADAQLTHCQLVIARELGFDSWPQLMVAVQVSRRSLAEQFLDLACLCYDDPHYDHRSFHRRARSLLEQHPDLVEESIWAAAAAGNASVVAALLDVEPDLVDRGGPHGWVPLLCACYSRVEPLLPEHSTHRVAELLLRRGASPRAETIKKNDPPGSGEGRRFTALTGLWGGGSTGLANQPPHPHWLDLAHLLLRHGADPADPWGLWIHSAAALPVLLEHGLRPEVRVQDDDGEITLLGRELSRAAATGASDLVELLLAHTARMDEPWRRRNPWEHAHANGHLALARRLEQAGAPTAPVDEVERFTALCLAGEESEARALLDVRPGLLARAPRSMVNKAVVSGRLEAVGLALDLGFDPSHLEEVTPLHMAATRDRKDLVDLLVARGGSLTVRDPSYDSTPVGWADFFARRALRDELLSTGPICLFDALDFGRLDRLEDILRRDPAAIDRTFAECLTRPPDPESRQTPLLRAVEKGDLGAARLLLDRGADPGRRHPDGLSMVQVARDLGHPEIGAALEAV